MKMISESRSFQLLVAAFCFLTLSTIAAESGGSSIHTYTVNRKVADFPTNENLSTPEAAYASCNRAFAAEGLAFFKRLSVPRLAAQMPPAASKPLPANRARELLDTVILEVLLQGTA